MDKELEHRALEHRVESSKWLFSIQSGLCAVIWGAVDGMLAKNLILGLSMSLGWFGFAFSACVSAVLLAMLPGLVEAMPDPAIYVRRKKRVDMLRSVQMVSFGFGVVMALIAMLVKIISALFGIA
ncbi:MAG: hypothetical protein JW726_15170 [Anaerolineales bacterium]|nr:hypothetical protein [Anaerolineales bacterium]